MAYVKVHADEYGRRVFPSIVKAFKAQEIAARTGWTSGVMRNGDGYSLLADPYLLIPETDERNQ